MRHSLPYVANCSLLFTEHPLLERPAAAKEAGFDAVEFWWPFATATPASAEVDDFVSAVRSADVRLVALNFAAGDMPAGDRGLLSSPHHRSQFRGSVDIAVAIGAQLGTIGFNALYGNRIDGVSPAEQDKLAVDNLALAARAAAGIGAVVLLEPLSGAPRYPLLTAAQAVGVIARAERECGVDNLELLADLYHLSVNGDDLSSVVATYGLRVGHVQVADAPGRHEPGTGELDLEHHLWSLQTAGYRGWVGLEYFPTSTTENSLDWLPRERRGAAAVTPRHRHPSGNAQ
jgi:hydroxypyruvate isomerase